MERASDEQLAQILWDYNNLKQPVKKADCILALGSSDVRIAHRAAELFLSHFAPIIVFSGGFGTLTKRIYDKTEAEVFADEAMRLGVPREKIYLENKSTNTGENIIFSRKLITEQKLKVDSIILVQSPYMLRRAYAAVKKQWPDIDSVVTGPQITFQEYPTQTLTKELIINIMVGDTQRLKLYPAKGFQIPQEIPEHVWSAYEELVKRGYSQYLIQ